MGRAGELSKSLLSKFQPVLLIHVMGNGKNITNKT